MKQDFKPQCAYCDSIYSAYELEISKDCSMARVAYSYQAGHDMQRKIYRWQAIKYTKGGLAYVVCRGRKLSLNMFMRLA